MTEKSSHQPETVKQVFVVGRYRSGTKWLSNLIANHPEVAALQREGAGGILEVNELAIVPRVFGPPEVDENYFAFLAFFEKTNTFKVSGLPVSVIHERRFPDYADFFAHFMDAMARARGATAWLQKASSMVLPEILRAFPNARIVVTRRENAADNIASILALKSQDGIDTHPRNLLREAYSYAHYRKVENCFRSLPNVAFTSYEDLKGEKEVTVRRVCEFLELPFDASMLEDRFAPNTSFTGKESKEEILGPWQRKWVGRATWLLSALPLCFFEGLKHLRLCLGKGRIGKRSFQRYTLSIWKEELNLK